MAFFVEQIKKIKLSDYSVKTQKIIKEIKIEFGEKAVSALEGEGFFIILDEYKDDVLGSSYILKDMDIYESFVECFNKYKNVTTTKLAGYICRKYHVSNNYATNTVKRYVEYGHFEVETGKYGHKYLFPSEMMYSAINLP